MSAATCRMIGGPMDGQLRAFPEFVQPTWVGREMYEMAPTLTQSVFENILPSAADILDAVVQVKTTEYWRVPNPLRHREGPRWLYIHESLLGKDYKRA